MANRLAGLLRAAAGEISIFPSLGRWMQAVAEILDGLSGPFIEVRRASSDQSVDFSAEEDLVFNLVSVDEGIAYDTTTGIFTLTPGLYELEFYGSWVNFGTPNVTAATAEWVSHPTNAALVVGFMTWVVAATSTQVSGSQPVSKVLYRVPAAGAQVKVRATSAGGGGTADLLRGSSYAIVRKVA